MRTMAAVRNTPAQLKLQLRDARHGRQHLQPRALNDARGRVDGPGDHVRLERRGGQRRAAERDVHLPSVCSHAPSRFVRTHQGEPPCNGAGRKHAALARRRGARARGRGPCLERPNSVRGEREAQAPVGAAAILRQRHGHLQPCAIPPFERSAHREATCAQRGRRCVAERVAAAHKDVRPLADLVAARAAREARGRLARRRGGGRRLHGDLSDTLRPISTG